MSADGEALLHEVHARLMRSGDLQLGDSQIRQAILEQAPLLSSVEVDAVAARLRAQIGGLGVLQPLLADDSVTDIMVVGNRGVWVERFGETTLTNIVIGATEIAHLIERIVAPLGLRVDRSSPMVDARLPDGSRVNAIVPPLAVDGPCLTIRRFGARPIPISELASPAIVGLLVDAVERHQNIVISGATGAGKTTLLNALSALIGDGERVITVEDAAELRLPLRHVVRLESRPANSEGVGRVTLRDLVRNALRMRPDRIVVGEIRGPEALDMLQAMNTGHEGSMSTCHANSPHDVLSRIETMVLMGEVALPIDAVRQQIAASVDLIVQVGRVGNGLRQVTDISEVGMAGGQPTVRRLATSSKIISRPQRPSRRLGVTE